MLAFLKGTTDRVDRDILVSVKEAMRGVSLRRTEGRIRVSGREGCGGFGALVHRGGNMRGGGRRGVRGRKKASCKASVSSRKKLPISRPSHEKKEDSGERVQSTSRSVPRKARRRPMSRPIPSEGTRRPSNESQRNDAKRSKRPSKRATRRPSNAKRKDEPSNLSDVCRHASNGDKERRLSKVNVRLIRSAERSKLDGTRRRVTSTLSLPRCPATGRREQRVRRETTTLCTKRVPVPRDIISSVLQAKKGQTNDRLHVVCGFVDRRTPRRCARFIGHRCHGNKGNFRVSKDRCSI